MQSQLIYTIRFKRLCQIQYVHIVFFFFFVPKKRIQKQYAQPTQHFQTMFGRHINLKAQIHKRQIRIGLYILISNSTVGLHMEPIFYKGHSFTGGLQFFVKKFYFIIIIILI